MDKEVVLQYVKLRNDYDNGIKTTITEAEQQLINQINSYALGNEEFKNIIIGMQYMTPDERIKAIQDYYEKIESSSLEIAGEEEKEIAKTFGIDVSNIEHKFLNNKNEIFYFYSMNLGREVILQNNKNDKSLVEQLKEIQQQNKSFQTTNNVQNTNNILEQQINNSNLELELYTINDIRNNLNIVNSMNEESYNKLNYLLNNYDKLNIKYINIDNLIYIDQNNKLREVVYDKENDRYYTDEPKNANYVEENQNAEISTTTNVEEINDDSNNYNIEEAKNYETENFDDLSEEIKNQVIFYYEYPEILDRMENLEEKKKYKHYVELYKQKLELEQQFQNQNKPKIKEKNDDLKKKAGYADALLLALISGFTFGIFATITFLFLNK